jgi:hypothetical protein
MSSHSKKSSSGKSHSNGKHSSGKSKANANEKKGAAERSGRRQKSVEQIVLVLQNFQFDHITEKELVRMQKRDPERYKLLEKEVSQLASKYSQSVPARCLFRYYPSAERVVSLLTDARANLRCLEQGEAPPEKDLVNLCSADEMKRMSQSHLLYALFTEDRIKITDTPSLTEHVVRYYWLNHEEKRCYPLWDNEAKKEIGTLVIKLASRTAPVTLEKDGAQLLETRRRIAKILDASDDAGDEDVVEEESRSRSKSKPITKNKTKKRPSSSSSSARSASDSASEEERHSHQHHRHHKKSSSGKPRVLKGKHATVVITGGASSSEDSSDASSRSTSHTGTSRSSASSRSSSMSETSSRSEEKRSKSSKKKHTKSQAVVEKKKKRDDSPPPPSQPKTKRAKSQVTSPNNGGDVKTPLPVTNERREEIRAETKKINSLSQWYDGLIEKRKLERSEK